MSIFAFGVLSVRIRYVFCRNGRYYFQKAVPLDLRQKYPGGNIKVPLDVTDPGKLAKIAERLNREYEAEFERLRGDPLSSPAALKDHAKAFLRQWGLEPGQGVPQSGPWETTGYDLLTEHFDGKRAAYAEQATEAGLFSSPDVAYHKAPASSYLEPVEREALKLLGMGQRPTVTDAMEFYFQRHPKGADEGFQKLPRIAVKQFIATIGDKAVEDVSREDVHRWMAKCVEKGHSKGTIQRRLNAIKAIFSRFIKEKELDIPNRFDDHDVPASAKKAKKRLPFSAEDLKAIQRACKEKDDDIRWIAAMQSDTCTRLAEIVGLRLSDIVLDTEIPYIKIEAHEARGLKTIEDDSTGDGDGFSERAIPLVGVALWAAQRVKATAAKHQVYAFPRYTKGGRCNATAASATINGWFRSKKINHTTHELRHTMKDRLRNVGCPEDVRKQIGGWARKDMSETYGLGYSLKVCHEWLLKVLEQERGSETDTSDGRLQG